MKLSEAKTIQDQLTVLSQRRWFKTHAADPATQESCPPEKIARADDPALSPFWDATDKARRTFQTFTRPTMKVAAEYAEKQPSGSPDEATRTAWSRLSMPHIRDVDSAEADALQEIGCAPVLDDTQPFDAEPAYADAHLVWLSLPRERQEDVPHPLADIVACWQERTPSVKLDTRPRGILPIPLNQARLERPESTQLPRTLSHERLGLVAQKNASLPGLEPPLSALVPALPLSLYDIAGGPRGDRGRGAPVAQRLFFEVLLSVGRLDRIPGQTATLSVSLRELIAWIWPNGWQRNRDMPKLQRALLELDGLRVSYERRLWRLVGVTALPEAQTALDDTIMFRLEHLPGSDHGPLINRVALRHLGLVSASAWRAFLRLAYMWDRAKAQNNGFPVYDTIPEVSRDRDGLTDKTGKPLLDLRGRRITNWGDTRAVHTGRRVRNPKADLIPVLGPADLARLGFDDNPRMSAAKVRDRAKGTRHALRYLEREKLVVLEWDGTAVRILQPYSRRSRPT